MSDVMLLGVLRMPMPDSPDPLTLRQFVSRARQAACRIEADADELEELRAANAAMKSDIARLLTAVDTLLAHCPDSECTQCGAAVCPHGEPLHFHHDGCPQCDVAVDAAMKESK